MNISAVIRFSDNTIITHSEKCENVSKTFESGFYEAYTDDKGILHTSKEECKETHDVFYTPENDLILNTINAFTKDGMREKINKLGFIHKLGVLLYGKQGTGKTSLMHSISLKLQKERDSIVFFCNSANNLKSAINLAISIRKIQDNLIIFIVDEFERFAKDAESEMKNFLDGQDSIDNMLFLAATNYLNKIPETLADRPSRFKVKQEFKGLSDKTTIKSILRNISEKINPTLFSEEELEERANSQPSFTLDEIKNMALDKATENYIPVQATTRSATIGFGANKTENVTNEKMGKKLFEFLNENN